MLIRTPRARITLLRPEQAHLLVQYFLENREHLEPWEPVRPADFYHIDGMRKRLAEHWNQFMRLQSAHFCALEPDGERVLATCTLHRIEGAPLHQALLGYSVDRAWEGTGLMHEVARAVMDFAWRQLQLHQLIATHAVDNLRSRRLLARLGFREVGLLPRYLRTGRGWEDHLLHHCLNPLEAGNHGLPSLLGEDGA